MLEMVTHLTFLTKAGIHPPHHPLLSQQFQGWVGDLDTQQAGVCHLPLRSLRSLKINAKAVHAYLIKTQKYTLWKYL